PTSGSGPARLSAAPDVNLLGAICLAPPLTSPRNNGIGAGQQPARRPTHRLRKGTKSCPHRRDSLPISSAHTIGRTIPEDRVIQFSCQGLWETVIQSSLASRRTGLLSSHASRAPREEQDGRRRWSGGVRLLRSSRLVVDAERLEQW